MVSGCILWVRSCHESNSTADCRQQLPFLVFLRLPCMNLRANLLPEMLHSSLETLAILSAILKQPNFSAENR